MPKHPKIYLKLFTATFGLSAFTFGGGFVIIPLMRKKFVDQLKWIDEQEMLDMDGWWATDGKLFLSLSYCDGTLTMDHTTELPDLSGILGG